MVVVVSWYGRSAKVVLKLRTCLIIGNHVMALALKFKCVVSEALGQFSSRREESQFGGDFCSHHRF